MAIVDCPHLHLRAWSLRSRFPKDVLPSESFTSGGFLRKDATFPPLFQGIASIEVILPSKKGAWLSVSFLKQVRLPESGLTPTDALSF